MHVTLKINNKIKTMNDNNKTRLIIPDDEGKEKNKIVSGKNNDSDQKKQGTDFGKDDPTIIANEQETNNQSGKNEPTVMADASKKNAPEAPIDPHKTEYHDKSNESLNPPTVHIMNHNNPIIPVNEPQNPETMENKSTNAEENKNRAKKWALFAGKALSVAHTIGGLPYLYGWVTDLASIPAPDDKVNQNPLTPDNPTPQLATTVNDNMSLADAFASARSEVGPGGMFMHQNKLYPTMHPTEMNKLDPKDRDGFAEAIQQESKEIRELPSANQIIPMELKILAEDELGIHGTNEPVKLEDAFLVAREKVGPGNFFSFDGALHSTYTKEEWESVANDPALLADYAELLRNEQMENLNADAVEDMIVAPVAPSPDDPDQNDNPDRNDNSGQNNDPVNPEVITRAREAVEVSITQDGVETKIRTIMEDGKLVVEVADQSLPPKYTRIGIYTGAGTDNNQPNIEPDVDPDNGVSEPPKDQNNMNISLETMEGKAILPMSEADHFVANSGGDYTEVSGELSGVYGIAKGIHGNVSEIEGDLTGLEGNVSRLSGDVTNVKGTIPEAEFVIINDVVYQVIRDEEGTPISIRELSEEELINIDFTDEPDNQIAVMPEHIDEIPEEKFVKAGSCFGDVSGVTGDMSNIWGDLSGITGNVSKLRGDVSGLSGDVSKLSGDVSNISGTIENLEGDVSNISGDISNISGEASNISGDVSDLSGDVSEISGTITSKEFVCINEEIYELSRDEDGFPKALRKLSDAESAKIETENSLSVDLEEGAMPTVENVGSDLIEEYAERYSLEGDVSGLKGEITNLYGDVSEIKGEISDLTGNASGLTGNVSKLSGDLSGIEGDIDSRLNGDVTDLHGDISEIHGYTGNIDGDVTGLIGSVTNLDGDVSGITGQIDGLTGKVSAIFGPIDNISGDASDINGDVSGITGDVSQISGDVTGITGNVTDLSGPVSLPPEPEDNGPDSGQSLPNEDDVANNQNNASGNYGYNNPEDPSHLDG